MKLVTKMLGASLLAALLTAPGARAATALGVADTSHISTGESVSALFSSGEDWVQTFLGVEGTSGAFRFGLGGAYRFTVLGNMRTGFHVGPGLSLGTVAGETQAGYGSKFAFHVFGAAGAHFTLFERMVLSVDAGPILSVVDGTVDFGLKPTGHLLGLSVHYLF